MKSFNSRNKLVYGTFLCITFFATSYAFDKLVLIGTRQQYEHLLEKAKECSKETGIPVAAVKQIIDWPMDDNRPSKEFFQCVLHNSGYTDQNGHYIIDSFLALSVKNGTNDDVVKALTECNQVTLEDTVETAIAAGDCAHKHFIFTVEKKEN